MAKTPAAKTPKPKPKQDGDNTPAKHRGLREPWQPGQSGNPGGRPKGSRHKLTEEFLCALAEDFTEHGLSALVEMREDRPGDYIRVIASLMPKDLNLNVNEYEHLTDEQLADRLEKLNRELEPYMRSIGRRH